MDSFEKGFITSTVRDYPNNYKFHSIEYHAYNVQSVTSRYCYDLLNLSSDLGGLTSAILGVFYVLVKGLADARTNSIIANRAYKNMIDYKESKK